MEGIRKEGIENLYLTRVQGLAFAGLVLDVVSAFLISFDAVKSWREHWATDSDQKAYKKKRIRNILSMLFLTVGAILQAIAILISGY
jgi:uncharacterized BrkB/YihY/UPF0761 family membrane protein